MTLPDLPEGFVAHDGGPCPVEWDSRPGVIFRDGYRQKVGEVMAGQWVFPDHGPDLWQWARHGPADIIAYRPTPPSAKD